MSQLAPILIVDDNTALGEDLQEILETEGFAAECAPDGATALDRLEGAAYSLVITDIRMPGMSGVEVLRYIKERWPGLPVVVMTAYAQDALLEEARSGGALAVLAKPLDIEAVVSTVAALVRADTPVLLVEDDDGLRSDLAGALQDVAGVLPHPVRTVAEALRVAGEVSLCAAIIDLRLPDGDGVSLARELRARLEPRRLPVVYITGHSPDFEESLGRVLSSPTVRLLEKPFSPDSLLALVREVV